MKPLSENGSRPGGDLLRMMGMLTLALIGFLGGLITGISPCILPVLSIFFSGASSSRRPYVVIAGLALSFSVVTLIGSTLLALLHLPQDAIRWAALVLLVLIGIGLIFPLVERLLERPFARIPQRQIGTDGNGFGLGLVLGVLFVPCAGPVLAAIVVAGATGSIGLPTITLTVAFALGATLPLLVFALAGKRITERVSAFRRRQRTIRIAGGIAMILLAVALVFDVPAALQRTIPDYTASLQDSVAGDVEIQEKLNLGGIVTDENRQLSNCTNGGRELQYCGPAPDIKGIAQWLNTPNGAPVDIKSLRGKVVLVDFWAYSCINCQRSIPQLTGWYDAYRDDGFTVLGIHTPEYAFEKVPANVESGARKLGISYPIAMDNGFSTWTNYRNRYWPARYLIDANGTVRHIKFGEGDYDVTEKLIRDLLRDANPAVNLPPATESVDTTPQTDQTPETYLSVGKVVNYGGTGKYDEGAATFAYPPAQPADSFALNGPWTLDYQGATAGSTNAAIRLNYHARNVYIVAGGTGTITVNRDGRTSTVAIGGPPNGHQIVTDDEDGSGQLEVRVSQGLQVFSFTYG
jgi:cytochrome c biogenesis protein CcdA/thiol-disulfide isomerase/thioredoxin